MKVAPVKTQVFSGQQLNQRVVFLIRNTIHTHKLLVIELPVKLIQEKATKSFSANSLLGGLA